jgi:hypothetical protein
MGGHGAFSRQICGKRPQLLLQFLPCVSHGLPECVTVVVEQHFKTLIAEGNFRILFDH